MWYLRLIRAVPFGYQPRQPHAHLIELLGQDLRIGSRLRFIEVEQKITGSHMHSVTHRDIRHHATGRVLNLLHVRFHHQCTRHDDRARQRHENRPATEDANTEDQNAKSDLELALKAIS